jgi:DNA-binding GntR family transcriptional regulator
MDEAATGRRGRGRPRKELIAHAAASIGPRRPRRAALHEVARDRLRRMIVHGQLLPGGGIGEAALCDLLGMSRTPVREALKLLAEEGLIELRSNRGAFVVPVRHTEIPALFEVAAGIERLGAELAAERATARDLARLRHLQERMEVHHDAAELDAYFDLNQQIHRGIIAMARNEVLTATHGILFARVERVRFLALGSRARWDESVREHREVLNALEARESERAGQALAAHVRHTGERAMALLRAQATVTVE